jgi:O-methyltransferase domain
MGVTDEVSGVPQGDLALCLDWHARLAAHPFRFVSKSLVSFNRVARMLDRNSPHFQRLADLLIGAKIAIALRATSEYKIADKLAAGPQSVEILAQEAQLDEGVLRRVLRALAQYGVFRETLDGKFENSDISEYMRSDVEPSLREAILFLNHNVSLRAWLELEQSLKDGKSHFVDVNGWPLFTLFARDKSLNEYFAKCMINLYGPEGGKIASGYPFGRFRTLIDVGGGQGHIIAAILSAHKDIKGTVFDIEPTVVLAKAFLLNHGLADRCDTFGGDFFVKVPGGYDAYILKSILHDWDDARAAEILKICRQAIPQRGRLLIIEEVVVPRQTVGNPHRFVDLEMLVHFGGKERTEPDYNKLMRSAGFSLERVVPIVGSFFSVIEGVPI